MYDKELVQSLGIDIFEAAPDPILLVSAGGEILAANKQAARCFGYDRVEMTTICVDDLLPEVLQRSHAALRESYQKNPHIRPMGYGKQLTARRKDDSSFPVEISLSPLQSAREQLVICIVRDITERKEIDDKLKFLSSHDLLTGLYNRSHFDLELARLDAERLSPITIVMIDVNGLKQANDTIGHAAGDNLLKRTAAVLHKTFRSDDLIARIGGDEFAVLIRGECDLADLISRVHQERSAHNEALEPTEPPLRFAVGAAIAAPTIMLTEALQEADVRMYIEKREQKEKA